MRLDEGRRSSAAEEPELQQSREAWLAELAEAENHHPDIDVRYRRVVVRWSTHSAGAVTVRDRLLAARTSALA